VTEEAERIAIITDSTCDIPPELVEKYQIVVVPLYVLWGEEQLVDGRDIDTDTFYARLPQDPIHPKTSQPTPLDFVRAIESLEAKEVLTICLSKELSGTYASACQAREDVDRPVHVVDSASLTMGLGWQVLAAARARERGAGLEEMIAAAQRVRERMSLLLTMDTLEYLHRGGRIGSAAKLLGSVIQLKPLLEVDHTSGVLEPVGRIRSRSKALSRLVDDTFERVELDEPLRVAVVHGAAHDLQRLVKAIEARCDPDEMIVNAITPVLGVHGGPGVVAVCAYNVPAHDA
jgi:DegV family protein with EDD domain